MTSDDTTKFWQALAKLHVQRRNAAEEENAFLWARLINLIEVVRENNYGDGSGYQTVQNEVDTVSKELMARIVEQLG